MITELENIDIDKNSLYIELKITSFCNMTCEYCFSRESKKSEIDFYKLFDFIKKYYPSRDKYIFYIYGGEPFLSKDLNNIINNIHEFSNNIEIIIQTNGTIDIKNSNIEKIKNIKFCLSYHMDYISSKHSEIFIKNLIYLKQLNILDDVSILFSNDNNQNNLLFKKLKILNINYHIKPLYQKAISSTDGMDQSKIIKVKYDDNETQTFSCSELQSLNITNFYNWTCSAGMNCILINYDGKIYNCEFDLINNRKHIFDLNMPDNNFKPCCKTCENDFCIQYHSDKILKG